MMSELAAEPIMKVEIASLLFIVSLMYPIAPELIIAMKKPKYVIINKVTQYLALVLMNAGKEMESNAANSVIAIMVLCTGICGIYLIANS